MIFKRFYFPLRVNVWTRNGYGYGWDEGEEHDGKFAYRHRGEIEYVFNSYQGSEDMAQYFYADRCPSLKAKMPRAEWRFEAVGDCLYGCVVLTLTEPLNEAETEVLKEWITGQNSDGLGEGFEQQEIRLRDGAMNVNFWTPDDDYRIYDETDPAWEEIRRGATEGE